MATATTTTGRPPPVTPWEELTSWEDYQQGVRRLVQLEAELEALRRELHRLRRRLGPLPGAPPEPPRDSPRALCGS